MLKFDDNPVASKGDLYLAMLDRLTALLGDERDFMANAANFSAFLFHSLPDLNWAGIYRWDGYELVLGPFQGKPACVRLALGRGVCGTAAERQATVVVADVHQFSSHIACDQASNSEIVVPLLKDGRLVGVLDLDSPTLNRFDGLDQAGLEALAKVFLDGTQIDF
jgi:L-methionine (R)-S-oxide reductase